MDRTDKKLKLYLRHLRMPTVAQLYDDLAETAVNNQMSYQDYLLELIEKECETRRNNRIITLTRESKLPAAYTPECLDMKRLPSKIVHRAKALMDGGFVERCENVLAFGNPGSGKSHLICAIGYELIRKGKKVLFRDCTLLVEELLQSKKDLTLRKHLKKLSRYDAIILDDLGYVQKSREEMDVLFSFFSERYERGSVMITSNLPFSKWDTIFKDPMITAAAIDRLVHHSVILELNLNSFRMEQAKKNRKESDKTRVKERRKKPNR